MGVPSAQIEEVKWVCLLTLLFNESLGVQYLVELAIQLVTVAFELVGLGSHGLVDFFKSLHQDASDFVGDRLRVLFNAPHFGHDSLKFRLDDVLLIG